MGDIDIIIMRTDGQDYNDFLRNLLQKFILYLYLIIKIYFKIDAFLTSTLPIRLKLKKFLIEDLAMPRGHSE